MIPTITPEEITAGYAEMASRYVDEGWIPYLTTFMFQQLGGSPTSVGRQMERDVERVYERFVTRVRRYPRTRRASGQLPIWIGNPDFPVFKYARVSLEDVSINDGQHVHAFCLQPPRSRLKVDVPTHFEVEKELYVRPDYPLARIHVVPVTHDVEKVMAYVLKAMLRGRVGADATFILPRHRSELPRR